MSSSALRIHGATIEFDLLPAEIEVLSETLAPLDPEASDTSSDVRYHRDEDRGGVRYHRFDASRSADSVPIGRSLRDVSDDVHHSVAIHATSGVFIHAGCVGWGGKAFLLPGPSHAGKTTLVHALVAAGAEYLSDEYAVIRTDGSIQSYARHLALRQNGTRTYVDPYELGVVASAPLPPGLILVTRHGADVAFDPIPLGAAGAALALFDCAVVARTRPEATAQAVASVARRVTAVRSDRGEAADTVPLILDLLERCDAA